MAPTEFDRRKVKTKELDDELTPVEIAKLIRDDPDGHLPFTLRSWLESGETPVRYVRDRWSDDASHYTANRGARSLVVVFCGGAHRVGVPISYFLQSMRDDLYDVLVLKDRRKVHYDLGVEGIGSFLETVQRVGRFSKERGYKEIITYGSSMGGLVALRAGILLRASRAISMNGSQCWHVSRLLRGRGLVRAFDVLCPCFSATKTELVAVVPSQHAADVRAAETVQQSFPACEVVRIDVGVHSLSTYLYGVRLLRPFHACMFEYWNNPVRRELVDLIARAAAHSDHVQTADTERIKSLRDDLAEAKKAARAKRTRQAQRLAALEASTSWRVTAPLRWIAEFVKQLVRATRPRL
jgi:hypothetical protein